MPKKEEPIKSLKFYIVVKKKLWSSTYWDFPVVQEIEKREKWYLTCDPGWISKSDILPLCSTKVRDLRSVLGDACDLRGHHMVDPPA